MARSVPVPIPRLSASLAEHRQICHDVIRSHWPVRAWYRVWRQRCICGQPWTRQVNDSGDVIVGCSMVRSAVAELAGLLEDRRLTVMRRRDAEPLPRDATVPLDRWRQR